MCSRLPHLSLPFTLLPRLVLVTTGEAVIPERRITGKRIVLVLGILKQKSTGEIDGGNVNKVRVSIRSQ
jgi:hypothetical protein